MKVGDVMTRDFGTVRPDETLQMAAQLMADLDSDALPVAGDGPAGGPPEGILTGRDIVLRAVAHGLDPTSTTVRQVMSSQVVSCRPDDPVEEVRDEMEQRQIRRMPVLDDDGNVIGMVRLRDLYPPEPPPAGRGSSISTSRTQ